MPKNVKRGYYVHIETSESNLGVQKKILNQIDAFSKHYKMKEIEIRKEKTNFFKSVCWRLPFGSYGFDYNEVFEMIEKSGKPDFIYMRHQLVDRRYLKFLYKIRKIFPRCKIIMEFPTYPYDGENLRNLEMLPFFLKDLLYRKNLCSVVDRAAVIGDTDEVFGVKALRIQNGIKVENVVTRSICKKEELDLDIVNMLAVGVLQKHHGYERIIRGMADYYSNNPKIKVVFHIVGSGSEDEFYKNLISEQKLEQYVKMYGMKRGEELDRIYDISDVAIASLGFYKINCNWSSTLKMREYLAKGMPVVSGCREDIFVNNPKDFYMNFPDNESNIDVGKIVEQYISLVEKYGSKGKLSDAIREFAINTVDMDVVINPIVDYIDDEEA